MNRKAFFILAFVMFLTMTGYGIVFPSLPYVAERLGLSAFEMGSLVTGWAVAQLIATPIWGRLIDRYGRKPILFIGLFGFGIAFLAIIYVQTYEQLLIARIIGAILSSGSVPAALTIVADSSKEKERGSYMAKMGAVNSLGFLCGPAIGGIFSPFGINAPFVVAGCLSLATLPLVYAFIHEPSEQQTKEKNKPVSFLASLSLMTKAGYRELYILTLGKSLAASSLFAILGYYMIEKFSSDPWQVSLSFSLFAGSSALVQFFLLNYFYQLKSEYWIINFGFLLCTLGYLCIAFSGNVSFVIIGCICVGFGIAFVRPTIMLLLSKQDRMGRGITMGLDQTMDSFGRVLGPLFGGFVFSVHMTFPFIGSALICIFMFAGIFISRRMTDENWSVSEKKKAYEEG